jgi:hypothetical protein
VTHDFAAARSDPKPNLPPKNTKAPKPNKIKVKKSKNSETQTQKKAKKQQEHRTPNKGNKKENKNSPKTQPKTKEKQRKVHDTLHPTLLHSIRTADIDRSSAEADPVVSPSEPCRRIARPLHH